MAIPVSSTTQSSLMSLREQDMQSAREIVVKLNVFRGAGTGALMKDMIAAVERKRSAEEVDMFRQVGVCSRLYISSFHGDGLN